MLSLYPVILLWALINSRRFSLSQFFQNYYIDGSVCFLFTMTVFYAFPICTPFISYFCLVALARIFGTILKRRDERGTPLPSCWPSSFSPLNMIVAVAFFGKCSLPSWGSPSIPSFLKVFFFFFNHERMLDFASCFSCIFSYDCVVFLI